MIKRKKKYCESCEKDTNHTRVGSKFECFLLNWKTIIWECDECGDLHEQDTAYIESRRN